MDKNKKKGKTNSRQQTPQKDSDLQRTSEISRLAQQTPRPTELTRRRPSGIVMVSGLHTIYLTIFAVTIRYERWLIDQVGLQGREVKIFEAVALVLAIILFIELVKIFVRRLKQ